MPTRMPCTPAQTMEDLHETKSMHRHDRCIGFGGRRGMGGAAAWRPVGQGNALDRFACQRPGSLRPGRSGRRARSLRGNAADRSERSSRANLSRQHPRRMGSLPGRAGGAKGNAPEGRRHRSAAGRARDDRNQAADGHQPVPRHAFAGLGAGFQRRSRRRSECFRQVHRHPARRRARRHAAAHRLEMGIRQRHRDRRAEPANPRFPAQPFGIAKSENAIR
ncbi:MAG: hypothetical protein BWZ10_02332 [candidate division BRC1 bacterium ADurb.BinA364]|nr:MAG: hypothetical protein BWZ10_02332 [candidate division BRC1 bacterium ADurb.BinA364]